MRRLRILVLAALVVAGFIILALVVAVVFFYRASHHQVKAFDDSDLIPTRIECSVQSNAYWTLLRMTNELYWPASLGESLRDLSHNTNWDDTLASDVLMSNRTCLDLFDQAMRQPCLLVPQPKSFDEDFPYLLAWRTICRVESIRINALFRKKKETQAFETAFKIIEFGQRAENSGGGIIHYLVGATIKVSGLMRLQEMTVTTSLSKNYLKGLIGELDRLRPNRKGLTNALKIEYQTEGKILADLAKGKLPGDTNSAMKRFWHSIEMVSLFNASETKMKFAQAIRVCLDNFSKPYSQSSWLKLPTVETNASAWSRLVKGNALGNILFKMLEPSLKSLAKRKSQEDVYVTATQLLLALRIYKSEHGELPESLSELVPEFFPQVPIDDFDGKPFRYLPDNKLIYSIGSDLIDSGGLERGHYSKNYDLPFEIEF